MNKELIKEWIAALRSGKYKQAPYLLHRTGETDSYCCLGVFCAIKKDELHLKAQQISSQGGMVIYDSCHNVLPPAAIIALQIPKKDAEAFVMKLIQMNDREHASFNQIADYLESLI